MAESGAARSSNRPRLDPGRPLLELKGIGPVRARQLAQEGVDCLGDLLHHVPFRYEDRRSLTAVGAACEGETVTLQGRLSNVRVVMRRGRRFTLVKGLLEDDGGSLVVSWFNRPYLPNQVIEGEDYLLHGKVGMRGEELELQNPSCERLANAVHTGRITPVYPRLGKVGPSLARRLLADLLTDDGPAGLDDPLPSDLLQSRLLPPLGEALSRLHLPNGEDDLEALGAKTTAAHARLIYGELLQFQLRLLMARRQARGEGKLHRTEMSASIRADLETLVPFELTGAQRRVITEIEQDMVGNRPMRRLLQGDVGSGKTIVAAAALLMAIDSGLQGAFMAPTELLAEQHFETFEKLLGRRCRVALLTGSSPGSPAVRKGLRRGEIGLVVGTHALMQERVEFRSPGLAVIDEQHRFGVAQRRRLGEKGAGDLLVMSATPIPRSLTLTAYGDLDLSIIDELPPGRRTVLTYVLEEEDRGEAYGKVLDEVERGGRAFIVFPAIGENPERRIASLERGIASSRSLLPGVETGVMHGQMASEERAAAMARFVRGETPVLLATTVIEVGVDVPEATVMVIEGAERFGLAQLHQLRGRVGRGRAQSTCFALHGALTDTAERRLEVFGRTNDGFEIAEVDLEIRGPGEVLGMRQSGLPSFRVADLARDGAWIRATREDARMLLEREGEAGVRALLAAMTYHAEEVVT
jgi:ATP-dependent DNA helicase RecG